MTTRRLAAILAADVVGFSSMMERDEEGTLKLLKTTQRDLIEPPFASITVGSSRPSETAS
jgi:adenylate cyclase